MTGQAANGGGGAACGRPDPGAPEFLGRERELAVLHADVARAGLDTLAGRPAPRSRVLLVAGRPGSGRTALAEGFTRQLLARGAYPDGVLRTRLTDPGGAPVPVERAARDLLGGLGVAAPAGAAAEELTDLLRETLSGRAALLLLDDVSTADQLAELIPDSRDCLVLAVGRGPLVGVPDVRPCTLGGLDQTAAVRLLVRGAGPTRVAVDPRAADALAAACGHLPAALLLAGGWLAGHPEATVADAVRKMAGADLQPLVGEVSDGGAESPAERDGPLERAFRLVYAGLPAASARLLRLLTLAPAGLADAHTAAALGGCSVAVAGAALDRFALLGLVRPATPDQGACEEPQYQVPGCLDMPLRHALRAVERPAEVALARARMLERVLRRLRACQAITEPAGSAARDWLAAQPGPLRFADRAAAAGWLLARLPALLACARLAVADGELDTLSRRLIAALDSALVAHHDAADAAPELYRLHELVLDVAERRQLPKERAAALLRLGDLDVRAGRLTSALGRYRAALEAARALGRTDRQAAGRAAESLGSTYGELGDWPRAADWYARALTFCQSGDNLDGEARLHGRVGVALAHAEQWEEALLAWRAAAAAHRRRGDRHAHARSLAEAARAQENAGRPAAAVRLSEEALRHAERTGDERLQVELLLRLARSADQLRRTEVARRHREAAERLLARSAPDPVSPATTLRHAYETQSPSASR